MQREASTVLRALLRDQTASIPTPLRAAPSRWHLASRRVTEVWELDPTKLSTEKQLALRALTPLVELIKLQPFPFGLCSVCDKVFVRVLGQKYCSPLCTYRGSEAARRDERRGYMKAYMRKYRTAKRARRPKEK